MLALGVLADAVAVAVDVAGGVEDLLGLVGVVRDSWSAGGFQCQYACAGEITEVPDLRHAGHADCSIFCLSMAQWMAWRMRKSSSSGLPFDLGLS